MRRPRSTATRTEVMPAPLILDPLAVFTAPQLRQALGLRPSSLRRQIREYGLVVCKRAGRYFFLGSDVLDWLSAGRLAKPDQADRNGQRAREQRRAARTETASSRE